MAKVDGYSTGEQGEAQYGGLIDLHYLGLVFIVVLIIGSLFEVGLLIYAYVNADKVECNLLWCTFTSGDTIEIKNSYSNITLSTSTTSQCFINGVEINCSEVEKYKSKFDKFLP